MEPRLLLLDNAIHRRLLHPYRHWAQHVRAIPFDLVNVPSGCSIPSIDNYTHLLVAGSETSIVEPKSWFEPEAETIRAAVRRRLPVLGSCFGHQMLVYALSGPESLARAARPEIGWTALQILQDDDLLAGLPNPWHAFSYHFDEVVDPPNPWRVLARSRDCATQVLRYEDLPVWGIQAHPEMPFLKACLFLGLYRLLVPRRRHVVLQQGRPTNEDRVTNRIVARFLAAGTES